MYIQKSLKSLFIGACLSAIFLLSSGLFVFASATSPPSFSSGVNVSNDSNIAQYPNVQTNGNNVFVVWTEQSHGIFFRSYSISGQTWTPPLTSAALRLSPQGTASYPLMTDSGNDVYVVWSQTIPTNKVLQIYFTVSTDGGSTFSTAKVIDTNPAAAASTPVIAASGNYVSVAWIAGAQSFVSASSNNGQTWSTPHQFSTKHEPQIAEVGANVYAIADGGALVVSHDAGTTWKAFTVGSGAEPWIAAVGSNVLVAWETKGKTSVINAEFSTNGGNSFSKKLTLSTSTPDAWAPMVNISGNSFFVAWRTNPNQSTSQEYVDVSTNTGSTWSGPTAIGIASRDNAWPFTIAASGSSVYTMWSEKANTIKGSTDWQTLVSYSSDGGSTWSTPVSLSTSASLGAQPEQDIATGSIASTGSSGFAVWQNNQTASQIYFSHT